MKKTSITVTEAARNFADCVNLARLVPDNEKVCTRRDLAEALAKTHLPEKEARAWRRDLRAARRRLKAPNPDH